MVPVMENSIREPLVIVSRRRRKEISWGRSPGLVVELERIWDMRIGRPVRVLRTRRWTRYLEPVKRRGGGEVVVDMATEVVLDSKRVVSWLCGS